jgi:hypothetical protein
MAFMIAAKVAPLGWPIKSRIFAPLLSAPGVLVFLAGAGLAAFLPTLAPSSASFFGEAAGALPSSAVFWPLAAPFGWVAPFFEDAFFGATVAPCSATMAAFGGCGFCGFHGGESFLRLAHDDSSLRWSGKAR